MEKQHFTYLLECSDNTLYCGYTTDLEKRLHAHNELKTWAKYTSARRPVKLVYYETFDSMSEALKRENEIKSLKREEKITLINTFSWTL